MTAESLELANLHVAFAGRDVLITGGLGFIGSSLAHRLVELGSRVTLVDSLIPHYGGNLFNIDGIQERVRVNIADVRDEASMNYLVRGRDIIFNLAGTLSHTDSMSDPYTDLEINCRSQLSILESCRKHNTACKILYAGTRGQYGRARTLPVDEDHLMEPVDVNGINKMAGERYHILYHQAWGLRATSLRLCNTYGPRHQMRHPKQGILNWFVRQVLEGVRIRIYGDGRQIRDTNYIDDVVRAFLLAAATPATDGRCYNLGGEPISLRDFVERLIALAGAGSWELVEFPAAARQVEVGDYVAAWGRFQTDTGWSPRVGLDEGIARTLEFYGRHAAHYWP